MTVDMARRRAFCLWCKRELMSPGSRLPDGRPHPRSFTRDHYVPRAAGGGRWFPCCLACNSVKADLKPAEWDDFRAQYSRWWELHPQYTARTIIWRSSSALTLASTGP